MSKDFEAKKQEIIDKLKAANDYIEWDDKLCASYRVSHASQMIAELQPPEPPTCATCDYCEHHEIDCSEGILSDCYRCVSNKLDWNMLPYIEEPANFGCLHHLSCGDTEND